MNRKSKLLAIAATLAAALPLAADAHCGANETGCVDAPCHHGANTPECLASTGAAKITYKIADPEVKQAVREIIIPKVPQLNLPVGGGAKPPANAPAPLGKIDTHVPLLSDTRPLPPNLPASAIARDVVSQIYAATFAATREIDNARALEELQKNNPRLVSSTYLTQRRQHKLGEIFEQLKRVESRTGQARDSLGSDSRYQDLSDSLSRASELLKSFGSGDRAAER